MSVFDFVSALVRRYLISLSDAGDAFVEAFECVMEDEVTKERDETRLMEESLRADRDELEAKERERSMLLREKDRMLAVKEAGENLVAEFLEADDGNNNFDEKAMMDAIEALIGLGGVDGRNAGEFGGIYGETINYPENTQNLVDEGSVVATAEGINSDASLAATVVDMAAFNFHEDHC